MSVPHNLIAGPAASPSEARFAVRRVRRPFAVLLSLLAVCLLGLLWSVAMSHPAMVFVATIAIVATTVFAARAWNQMPVRARRWYPDILEDRQLLHGYIIDPEATEADQWTAATLERRMRSADGRTRHPEVAALLHEDVQALGL